MRPPGAWDPFEAGVGVIVAENAGPGGTTMIMRRITERHGREVPGLRSLGLTHVFPAPWELAAADLHGLGLPAAASSAIRGLASAAAGLDQVSGQPAPAGSPAAIPGMTAATAQALALRLGEPDAFPASSPALLQALSAVTGHPVPAAEAERIAGRWRPWRAHAAIHLLLGAPGAPAGTRPPD
jgi:AraC family transcriptional regulator, regulatory protein of adaptative response / DNA-3-methyladenine glycosylase II